MLLYIFNMLMYLLIHNKNIHNEPNNMNSLTNNLQRNKELTFEKENT